MRSAIFALIVSVAAGCGPGASEGEGEPEAPFAVEIGSGRETFVPLADGDIAFLERGFQGAQHVLVSVRALAMPQDRYLVDFRLVREDGLQLSEPSSVRVPFESMPDEAGAQIFGYRLVVGNDALDDALGSTATLSATVQAEVGASSDERVLEVELAPEGYDPDA